MSKKYKTMWLLQNDGGDYLGVFDTREEAFQFAEYDLVDVGYDPTDVSVNDVYGIYQVRYWM